jgi:regulatory protein
MTVTLVSYRGDSVHLVFDTGDSLTLPVSIEYSRFYRKGLDIAEDEFSALKIQSEKHICIQKAMNIVARSAQSVRLLTDKLKKKKIFSESAIKEAVGYLVEKGYVSDEDFARRYAQSLSNRKDVGKRRIFAELMKKGINKQIAESVIKELHLDEDNLGKVTALALKKAGSIKQKDKVREKVWRFLLSRGYSDGTIRKVLSGLKTTNKETEEDY